MSGPLEVEINSLLDAVRQVEDLEESADKAFTQAEEDTSASVSCGWISSSARAMGMAQENLAEQGKRLMADTIRLGENFANAARSYAWQDDVNATTMEHVGSALRRPEVGKGLNL